MKNTTIRKISTSALISTVLLVSVMAKADDSPSTKIILSPETTRISEPLNDDGTVNYLAALNEQYSKGVTAENNAAVLLIKAAGPDLLPEAIREQVPVLLGISVLPEKGDYFVSLYEYTDGSEDVEESFEIAQEEPWSVNEYPQLAAWLRANDKPLELVIKATNRQRFYMPLIMAGEDRPQVLACAVAGLQIPREMASALVSRAMLKFDSGDVAGSLGDLLAVHRLARLVGQGPTLIGRLVGCALESVACNANNALATRGWLTSSQAREYLSELEALPALPSMTEAIDICERFTLLDSITFVYRGVHKDEFRASFETDAAYLRACLRAWEDMLGIDLCETDRRKAIQALSVPMDWNQALRMVNSWYDRVVDAGRKPTFAEKVAASGEISAELKALRENGAKHIRELLVTEEDTNTSLSEEAASKRMTQAITKWLISIFTADVGKTVVLRDMAIMRMRASQVALALAGYRAEVGSYPEDLAKLCPKYFKTVPEDLFAAKPVDYRRVKNGYVLYSPGAYDEDYDDIVVETAGSVNK